MLANVEVDLDEIERNVQVLESHSTGETRRSIANGVQFHDWRWLK